MPLGAEGVVGQVVNTRCEGERGVLGQLPAAIRGVLAALQTAKALRACRSTRVAAKAVLQNQARNWDQSHGQQYQTWTESAWL